MVDGLISKKLQRQIKSAFKLTDSEERFLAVQQELSAKSNLSPAEELLLQLVEGFPAFLKSVQDSYDQGDKMLVIVNRSLLISSEELNATNSRLADANKTVETMLANLGQDLDAAREVQRSLLPPANQDFPAASVNVLYQPAERLSGDFYDVSVKGPWIYFYIADVTSHGTASAQVTYIVKGIFQELINQAPEPLELHVIMKEFGLRYLTYKLPYAVGLQIYRFNTETKMLQIMLSNTPPPIRVRKGTGENIHVKNAPLLLSGAHEETPSEEPHLAHEVPLESGDILYCFTDGILEANKKSISERLVAKIFAAAAIEDWQTSLIATLKDKHQTEKFDDDLTVLRLIVK